MAITVEDLLILRGVNRAFQEVVDLHIDDVWRDSVNKPLRDSTRSVDRAFKIHNTFVIKRILDICTFYKKNKTLRYCHLSFAHNPNIKVNEVCLNYFSANSELPIIPGASPAFEEAKSVLRTALIRGEEDRVRLFLSRRAHIQGEMVFFARRLNNYYNFEYGDEQHTVDDFNTLVECDLRAITILAKLPHALNRHYEVDRRIIFDSIRNPKAFSLLLETAVKNEIDISQMINGVADFRTPLEEAIVQSAINKNRGIELVKILLKFGAKHEARAFVSAGNYSIRVRDAKGECYRRQVHVPFVVRKMFDHVEDNFTYESQSLEDLILVLEHEYGFTDIDSLPYKGRRKQPLIQKIYDLQQDH